MFDFLKQNIDKILITGAVVFMAGMLLSTSHPVGAQFRVLTVPQGGTGAVTFTTGECLVGNGAGAITTQGCGGGGGGGGGPWSTSTPLIYNNEGEAVLITTDQRTSTSTLGVLELEKVSATTTVAFLATDINPTYMQGLTFYEGATQVSGLYYDGSGTGDNNFFGWYDHVTSDDFVFTINKAGDVNIQGQISASSTATSTFAQGIDLDAGCFAVDGTCITGGGASAINDLSDVDTTGLSTNDILYYNSANWVPTATSTWDTTCDGRSCNVTNTGTFDGQQGTYYLDADNLTNFGNQFFTFFSATNTDALSEGSSNLYNQTHTGDVTGATGLVIANDVVAFTDILYSLTLAGNPALGSNEVYFGLNNGIIFEGSSGGADTLEGLLTSADITGSDKTWTLPNTTGSIALTTSAMTGTFDGNNFGGGAIGVNQMLYGGSAGSFSELAAGTSGQVLQANGSGVPTFVTVSGEATMAAGGAVTLADSVAVSSWNLTTPTLTSFFGTPCTGNEFLQDISDTGTFSCTAATGGGSGTGAFATTTIAGDEIAYYTDNQGNARDVMIGSDTATSSASWWHDTSATTTYLGTGGAGTSSLQLNGGGDAWLLITGDDVRSFILASSTATDYNNTKDILTIETSGAVTFTELVTLASEGVSLGGNTLTGFSGNGVIFNSGVLDFDCSDVTDSGGDDGVTCTGEDIVVTLGNDVALGSEVTGDLPFANLTQLSANSVLANVTGGTADGASLATSSLFAAGTAGNILMWTGTDWEPHATATCEAITGSSALCDGDDATGGAGVWTDNGNDLSTTGGEGVTMGFSTSTNATSTALYVGGDFTIDASGTLICTSCIGAGDVEAELYTETFSLAFASSTLSTTTAVAQHKLPTAVTITRITCSTDIGTTSLQFDERAEGTPNTSGTDVMQDSMSCGSEFSNATSTFDNAAITADNIINLDVDTTDDQESGASPTNVRIHVEYTIDD